MVQCLELRKKELTRLSLRLVLTSELLGGRRIWYISHWNQDDDRDKLYDVDIAANGHLVPILPHSQDDVFATIDMRHCFAHRSNNQSSELCSRAIESCCCITTRACRLCDRENLATRKRE